MNGLSFPVIGISEAGIEVSTFTPVTLFGSNQELLNTIEIKSNAYKPLEVLPPFKAYIIQLSRKF